MAKTLKAPTAEAIAAAQWFADLKAGRIKVTGKNDGAGRWYPTEPCKCDVRNPSRAWPNSFWRHVHTAKHAALKFGVTVAEMNAAKRMMEAEGKIMETIMETITIRVNTALGTEILYGFDIDATRLAYLGMVQEAAEALGYEVTVIDAGEFGDSWVEDKDGVAYDDEAINAAIESIFEDKRYLRMLKMV